MQGRVFREGEERSPIQKAAGEDSQAGEEDLPGPVPPPGLPRSQMALTGEERREGRKACARGVME
jgi:hypothetical protein